LQATASSNLPVTYTVTGPAFVTSQNLTITGAGAVTVTANQSGNSSYFAAPPVARTFTVAPAVLTVSAQNLSMAYGAPLPTLLSSTTGFVNGDSASVVTGSAALSTAATSTSPVGAYTITAAQGTLAATNYNFVFVNGVLDIFGGRR
jgi:MBG domain (YGX type)